MAKVIPQELEQIFANGEQADVPVLIGSNADESTAFMPFFEPLYGSGEQGFDRYLSVTTPRGQGSGRDSLSNVCLCGFSWTLGRPRYGCELHLSHESLGATYADRKKPGLFVFLYVAIRRFPSATVIRRFIPRKSAMYLVT